MTYWSKEEEQLFRKVWNSGEYPLEEMARIFQRSEDAIRKKADTMGLENMSIIEAKVRVKAIREAIEKELVI